MIPRQTSVRGSQKTRRDVSEGESSPKLPSDHNLSPSKGSARTISLRAWLSAGAFSPQRVSNPSSSCRVRQNPRNPARPRGGPARFTLTFDSLPPLRFSASHPRPRLSAPPTPSLASSCLTPVRLQCRHSPPHIPALPRAAHPTVPFILRRAPMASPPPTLPLPRRSSRRKR